MALKDFLEEASIMKEMKHPNLVQLLGNYLFSIIINIYINIVRAHFLCVYYNVRVLIFSYISDAFYISYGISVIVLLLLYKYLILHQFVRIIYGFIAQNYRSLKSNDFTNFHFVFQIFGIICRKVPDNFYFVWQAIIK